MKRSKNPFSLIPAFERENGIWFFFKPLILLLPSLTAVSHNFHLDSPKCPPRVVFMHACVCLYVYVCICVHVCLFMRFNVYIHMCIRRCIPTCLGMFVYMYAAYLFICINIRLYISHYVHLYLTRSHVNPRREKYLVDSKPNHTLIKIVPSTTYRPITLPTHLNRRLSLCLASIGHRVFTFLNSVSGRGAGGLGGSLVGLWTAQGGLSYVCV